MDNTPTRSNEPPVENEPHRSNSPEPQNLETSLSQLKADGKLAKAVAFRVIVPALEGTEFPAEYKVDLKKERESAQTRAERPFSERFRDRLRQGGVLK